MDDGKIYGYYLGPNVQIDIEVDKLFSIQGEKGCREILFINRLDQIVVGHDSGIVSVYDIENSRFPFYSRKVHNKDITKMDYLEDLNILLTASKDQSLKFWKIKHSKEELAKPQTKSETGLNPFQNLEDDEDDPFSKKVVPKKEEKKEPVLVKNPPKVQKVEEKADDSDEDLAGWND